MGSLLPESLPHEAQVFRHRQRHEIADTPSTFRLLMAEPLPETRVRVWRARCEATTLATSAPYFRLTHHHSWPPQWRPLYTRDSRTTCTNASSVRPARYWQIAALARADGSASERHTSWYWPQICSAAAQSRRQRFTRAQSCRPGSFGRS